MIHSSDMSKGMNSPDLDETVVTSEPVLRVFKSACMYLMRPINLPIGAENLSTLSVFNFSYMIKYFGGFILLSD